MPAMVACGRRWPIGSDDLVFPGVASLITRVLVISSLVFALIAFRENLSCDDTVEVIAAMFTMLVLAVVIGVLEIFIVVFSARGSIVNPKPRRPVVYLLYFRMAMFCLETVLTIIGTVFAFVDKVNPTSVDPACADLSGPTTALRVVMVLMCLVLLGIILGILSYVDPCRLYRSKVHYNPQFSSETVFSTDPAVLKGAPQDLWQRHHSESYAFWVKALRCLFCACNSKVEHRHFYSDVAAIFSRGFFDVNVVASDVVAMLILLHRHQQAEERNRMLFWEDMDDDMIRGLLPKFSDSTEYFCKPVDFTNSEEREIFHTARYYLRYAIATFTWKGYLYFGESFGCCKLASQICKGGCCCHRRRDYFPKDNSCSCHLYSFSNLAEGIREEDIIHFSLENGICQVPFCVLLDHVKETVVVAIRGTMSMNDVVTDLIASAEPVLLPAGPNENQAHFAHKGMLQTAMWVKDCLYKEGYLNEAFSREPTYNLVITGISLGAGCASLLGLLLKQDFPNLKCYIFSSPNAMLDINSALYTQSFIVNVTVGKDFISRLSVYTSYLLKHDLLKLASVYSEKPKYRILLEGLIETLSRFLGKDYSFPVKPIGKKGDDVPSHSADSIFGRGSKVEVELKHQAKYAMGNTPRPPATSPYSFGSARRGSSEEVQPSPLLYPPSASWQDHKPVATDEQDGRVADIEVQERNSEDEPDRLSINSLLPTCDEELGLSASPHPEMASVFFHHLPLFPPGKVIHLREVRPRGQCFLSKRRYEAHWVSNESFQRIIINQNMLRDHMPNTTQDAMNYVWEHEVGTEL